MMPGMPPEAIMQMMWPQAVMQVAQATSNISNPVSDNLVGAVNNGLDLNTLNPMEYAPQRTIPGLFLHAIDDTLIPMSHTERNFDAYGGAVKDVSYFDGDHNSERPDDTNQMCITFLRTHLLDPPAAGQE